MYLEILKDIFFVGYVDWSIRDFHSFETKKGVTYNSFLIKDEKVALVDCVKDIYLPELIKNVKCHVSLDKIDYLIVNHAEPDHAGALAEFLKECKDIVIVCTAKCKDILAGYFDIENWNFKIVKTGDQLSLGKRNLEFIETPMVHWPDSMFTYVKEDKALFSMDAFGQHFSSSDKFDEEVDYCQIMEEAKKYYANIVMPYGKQVLSVLEKVSAYDIEMIIPSHGVIWKKYIKEIISNYKNWAGFIPSPKVLIVYDTMWQSTKIMAEAIYLESSKHIETKLLYARATSLTEIVTEVLDAGAIAFGSSTLNMTMMPQMGAILTYIKGLNPQNKAVSLFGSHGWGKGAIEDMENWLLATKMEKIADSIKAKWRPDSDVLKKCGDLGKLLAEKALEKINRKI